MWLSISANAADAYRSEAWASIQATATVVPSLGFTSPDETLSVSTAVGRETLGAYEVPDSPDEVSFDGRLLMRYPSGSVALLIEDESGDSRQVSLSELEPYIDVGTVDGSGRPGAAVLNLHRLSADREPGHSSLIVTLVYTEN